MASIWDILGSIDLDDNAYVSSEYKYNTKQHKTTRTLSGKFVVETFSKTAYGERITLTNMWLTRSTLDSLQALANANAQYEITLTDGTSHDVVFNLAEGVIPIKADPIFPDSTSATTQKFNVTLEFLKVEAEA